MDNRVDRRNIFEEEIFTYKISKDKKVFISWRGKPITILNGVKAESFIADIAKVEGREAQLIMAKATGNFKRGNEKIAKRQR